jgi:Kef-type K+ transport system membrane component KefB
MLTAYFIYDRYAGETTPFLPFALFVGIAMSITAFPVLARIIQEQRMTKSHIGNVTLVSAANGDITAWCLLAVVLAIAQAGSALSAVYNILFAGAYVLFMLVFVRTLLKALGHICHNKEVIDKGIVALMFLILIVSSYLIEVLGMHALFGAFIAGVVMPSNLKFRKILSEKVEDVALSIFLPLFFVSTGLRTEIGLLNTPELWVICGIVTLIAVVGKVGSAYFSARFVGENIKNSLYIGVLMNTRGLMELVVLAIGYELGILPPPVFVMLVLMTLVTTFMTVPLLSLLRFIFRKRDKSLHEKEHQSQQDVFKVLISFGRAGNGLVMLDAAYQMFSKGENKLDITALHMTLGADVNPLQADNFEEVSFGPIIYGAQRLGIHLKTQYEIAHEASQEITRIARQGGYDFLMVGAPLALSNLPADKVFNHFRNLRNLPTDKMFNRFRNRMNRMLGHPMKMAEGLSPLGGMAKDKTKIYNEQSNCPVGVFVNRRFVKATNVLLVIGSREDLFLFKYAQTLLKSTKGNIAVVNLTDTKDPDNKDVSAAIEHFIETQIRSRLHPDNEFASRLFEGFNFMLISYRTWSDVKDKNEALSFIPSTLILSR